MNKLVVVLSDHVDAITSKVIKYIYRSGYSVCICEIEELYSKLKMGESNFSSFWLRKQNFRLGSDKVKLINEAIVLNHYRMYLVESNVKVIGSILADYKHNKLIDLSRAEKVGLNVPKSYIVSTKLELEKILTSDLCDRYITKALYNLIEFETKDFYYFGGEPIELFLDDLKNVNVDSFLPSLVQEYINKEFEIRILFIMGKFYPMAIFSQSNLKTELDYRNYDKECENRNIPFKLPLVLENQLKNLMDIKELNFGSIDMVYSREKIFYFLEVNPIGQFGWLSENCNFNVEEIIAKHLSNSVVNG